MITTVGKKDAVYYNSIIVIFSGGLHYLVSERTRCVIAAQMREVKPGGFSFGQPPCTSDLLWIADCYSTKVLGRPQLVTSNRGREGGETVPSLQ